jgi:hypothetical protein
MNQRFDGHRHGLAWIARFRSKSRSMLFLSPLATLSTRLLQDRALTPQTSPAARRQIIAGCVDVQGAIADL